MAKKRIVVPRPRADADRRIRQADRIARVWRVLQIMLGRGRRNAREIADELECSERTVYRDLQVLELAGVPWAFDEASKSYQVRPGWQFPALKLTEEEIVGQAVATAATKASGLKIGPGAAATTRKLAATLSEQDRQRLADATQMVAVLDLKLADHSRSQDILRTVQGALLERKQVSGQYASPYHDKPTKLTLHPYRLCLVQQAWYLIARSANANEPRTYRIQRFKAIRRLNAAAEMPPNFNLAAYFGNAWGVYRGQESFDVELLFAKEAASIVLETTWHRTQKATRHSDGSVTLRFQVDGLEEIVWWILGWSGRVQVIGPKRLREMVVEHLGRALAMNATDASRELTDE